VSSYPTIIGAGGNAPVASGATRLVTTTLEIISACGSAPAAGRMSLALTPPTSRADIGRLRRGFLPRSRRTAAPRHSSSAKPGARR
jgi:hypothetical protein